VTTKDGDVVSSPAAATASGRDGPVIGHHLPNPIFRGLRPQVALARNSRSTAPCWRLTLAATTAIVEALRAYRLNGRRL